MRAQFFILCFYCLYFSIVQNLSETEKRIPRLFPIIFGKIPWLKPKEALNKNKDKIINCNKKMNRK